MPHVVGMSSLIGTRMRELQLSKDWLKSYSSQAFPCVWAMPNTFEKRARDALEAKDDSFRPRGEKNRARFEEMKREMQTELASDVAQGKQSIRHAGNKAVRHITNAADVAEQKIEAAAAEAVAKALKKRKLIPAAQDTEETSNTTSSDPSSGLSETGVPAPTAELPSTLAPAAAAEPGDRGQGQSLPEQPAAAEPADREKNAGEEQKTPCATQR